MAAEPVGSAYVVIRAVTTRLAKDIKDGLDKGAKEADVDSAGHDLGDRLGESSGDSFGESFNERSSRSIEESADSKEMKKSQRSFTDKLFGRFKEGFDRSGNDIGKAVGARFQSGLENSTRDIDVNRAAGSLGSDLGDEVGNDFDASFSRRTSRTFASNGNNDRLTTGASGFGLRLGQSIGESTQRGFTNTLVGFGDSIAGALNSIKIPGGSFAILAQLALPALGGALQTVGALIGSTTAVLGFLGTAALGAGVAFAGLAAAAAPAFFLIKGAFGVDSPALDHFNEAVEDFKDDWEAVGLATQELLLPGLEGALDLLKELIPTFESYGKRIGEVVGGIALGAAATLADNENKKRLDGILQAGATIIETLGDAAVTFLTPLLTILHAAMPVAQRLADAIARVSDKFASWVAKKDAAGELTGLFDKWYDRLALVMSILGNIGSALADVFGIGADSVDGMFKNLDGITQKWAEWTNSDEGQSKLITFFENAKKISGEVFGIIGDIAGRLFGGMFDEGGTDGLLGFFQTIRDVWIPTLSDFVATIKDALSGPVGDFFDALTGFLRTLADNPEITAGIFNVLLTNFIIFTKAIELLSAALNTDIAKRFGPLILKMLLFMKIAATLWPILKFLILGFKGIAAAIGFIFSPIGLVVAVIAAIVGAILLFYFHFKPFRDFVDRNIIDPLQRLWKSIEDVGGLFHLFEILPALLRILWDSLPTVDFKKLFEDPLGTLAGLAHDVADALRNTFAGIPLFSQIANGLAAAFDFVGNSLTNLKKLIKNPLKGAGKFIEFFHNLGKTIGDFVGKGLDLLIRNLPNIGTILGKAFGLIVKVVLGVLGTLIAAIGAVVIPSLIALFKRLPSLLLATLKGLANFAVAFLEELGVLDAVQKYFPIVVGVVIGFFKALPGMILDAIITYGPIVAAGLLAFVKFIGQALLAGIQLLPGLIGAVGGFLLDKGLELVTGIYNGALAFWKSTLKPWFEDLPGNIVNAIQFIASGAGRLGEKGLQLLGAFLIGVKNFFRDEVLPWFGHLPGRVIDAIKFIGTGLGKVGVKGQQLLGAFLNGVLKFFTSTVLPWFGHLPGRIIDAISFVGSGLGRVGQRGQELLGAFLNGVINFFTGTVLPWFGHLPGLIIDAISFIASGAGRLGAVGAGLLGAILNGVTDFFTSDVLTWFQHLPGLIVDGIGGIASWAGDMLHLGSELMRQLLLGLIQWGQEHAPEWIQDAFHFDQLEDAIAPGLRHIREAFDRISGEISNGIAADGPELQTAYGAIFSDIFENVGEDGAVRFAEAWSAAMASGGGLDPSEIEALMALAEEILSEGGTQGAAGFASGLSAGFKKIAPEGIGKDLAGKLKKGVSDSFSDSPFDIPLPDLTDNNGVVMGWAQDSGTSLRKTLGSQIGKVSRNEFKKPSEALVNNLGDGLDRGKNLLRSFSLGLVLTIVKWIQTTVKLMQIMGLEMMQSLQAGLIVGFIGVQSVVKKVPVSIIAALGATNTLLTPAGMALMAGMTRGIQAGAIVMLALLRGLRASAVSAVGSMSGLLTAQGAALVNGITNGVRGATKQLYGAVRSLADVARDAAGSMIKVLYPAGQSLVEGMINGIRSMLPALRAAAQAVRDTAASAKSGSGIPQLAMGAIINGPMVAQIGEAGREVVIPLTRPLRALSLLHASGLDELVRQGSPTGGDVTLLNIEHAEINDKVDVDMVAARLNSAYKAMISTSGTRAAS